MSYGYAIFLITDADLKLQGPRLVLLLVWMIGAAAFGHYINDIFDLKDDLVAGKTNSTKDHSKVKKIAVSTGLASLALTPWLLLPCNRFNLSLVLIHLLIFLLYSTPPIRLKERGIAGVVSDAVYAHVVPALVVVTTLWSGNIDAALIAMFIVWQFLIGCRNILNHQIDDHTNDLQSKTYTIATHHGVAIVGRLIKLVLIPLELISLLFIFYLLGIPFTYLIWAFLGYVVYTFGREVTFLRGKITEEVVIDGRYDYLSGIMLNEFYEKWLPLLLLIYLVAGNWTFGLLLVIHLVIFASLSASFLSDLRYFHYLVREIARNIYFGIEKYIRHFFQSTLPSIWDNGFYGLYRLYWRFVVQMRNLYWAWIRFYRNHVVRIAWIVIKFYYRVEYKLWKIFYKPLKDKWKGGK
ncbi:MAG: UbiA family prenyltransferase [Bacteroidetes bacterium]|nr:UbiA family prenyltransferase [Bacteroidota bacterium]